jgi:beta-lactamase regulating signal transducer with metallopeptidase domain
MISALVPLLVEASIRALVAAVAVWSGLRLLGVGNVLVQKVAWGLVLLAALAMPLVPRGQAMPARVGLKLPAVRLPALELPVPSKWMQEQTARPQLTAPAPPVAAAEPDGGASRYPAPVISTAQFDTPTEEPAATGVSSATVAVPATLSSSLNQASPLTTKQAENLKPPVAQPRAHGLSLVAVAWSLYLGVFAGLLLRMLFGLVSALRLWLTAEPAEALGEQDSGVQARVRTSSRVASPVNIGSGIVLPADYTGWDEEKLRIVLAHERSHIRQGDFYLQLAAAFYAALFWFSPLGWWLKRKLYELGEAISDRAGLEQAASRSSYAQILLEFAALPRPTLTGVAMARTSHLSQRIERLLNESSFRHSFAAAGRRALLAVLLVPVALFAATALVRVEASVETASKPAAITGQSTPEQVTDTAQPQSAPSPAPNPPAEDAQSPAAVPSASAPAGPTQPLAPPSPDAEAPLAPPAPDFHGDPRVIEDPKVVEDSNAVVLPKGVGPDGPIVITIPKIDIKPIPRIAVRIPKEDFAKLDFELRTFPYITMDDGEEYALVGEEGAHTRLSNVDGQHKAEIDKARQMTHGHFLWFRHDDKSYIVDDPAIVAQVEAMEKPVDDLSEQMKALGKQMRDLGQQQRDLGSQMRAVNVPTPDLSKEIADLTGALTTLQSKQGSTINQKEIGDLQRQMGQIMGQLGALEGKIGAEQSKIGGSMGQFGKQQGELGGQMGKLGGQMGQLSRENHEKIKGIIKDSLANGKARPVQ